jgi:hypothetical protein
MKRMMNLFPHLVTEVVSSVGSSHIGEGQLRGREYMNLQAQTKLQALRLGTESLNWYCLNDIVMGGRSSSTLKAAADGSLLFRGHINTNGGGFASCRTGDWEPNETIIPQGSQGVKLTVSFQHTHCFKFSLSAASSTTLPLPEVQALGAKMRPQMKRRWESMSETQRQVAMSDINWQCTFPEADAKYGLEVDHSQEIFLPFDQFTPSLYGQRLSGLKLDAATITHIGFLAGVFDTQGQVDDRYTNGPFRMQVHRIEFV